MNENISLQERANETRQFCERHLSRSLSEYEDLSTEARAIFINSIAFALNDEKPLLVTEQITNQSENMIEFAIFTETRVLYFNGKSEAQQPVIQAIPRRTLKELRILGSAAVIEAGRYLTNRAQYALTYDNGTQFNLPLSHSTADMQPLINRCLPSLYDDLNASHI
ncbi:hypothetical protein ACNPM8_07745 [Glutamicibacter sp. AGC46]